MENEQQNQATYEHVIQAYNNLFREFESNKLELQSVKTDKLLEKLNLMLGIIKDKNSYPKEIVNLAKWHVKQILARPKN